MEKLGLLMLGTWDSWGDKSMMDLFMSVYVCTDGHANRTDMKDREGRLTGRTDHEPVLNFLSLKGTNSIWLGEGRLEAAAVGSVM